MIEIRELNKSFGTIKAINNLTVNFNDGIYGLVGQNGAGKSTLLRIISNVVYKDSGSITVGGFDSSSKESREQLLFISDNPYYQKRMKIKDLFKFYSIFYNLNSEYFYSLINEFGLPLDQNISSFSKGMRRQVFIAIGLSSETKILLMDEAFDGIDPLVIDKIKTEFLKKKTEGKTIILSGHNISSLERLVDSFVLISKGRLASQGGSEDLGNELVKYQAFIKQEVSKEDLESLGLKIVVVKKVGSIYNFVFKTSSTEDIEKIIKEKYNPILFETIPLDPDEVIAVQMLIAKEEN